MSFRPVFLEVYLNYNFQGKLFGLFKSSYISSQYSLFEHINIVINLSIITCPKKFKKCPKNQYERMTRVILSPHLATVQWTVKIYVRSVLWSTVEFVFIKLKRNYTASQKHESTLLHTYVLNEFLIAERSCITKYFWKNSYRSQ